MATISKWNGIDIADMATFSGVDTTSLAKINGLDVELVPYEISQSAMFSSVSGTYMSKGAHGADGYGVSGSISFWHKMSKLNLYRTWLLSYYDVDNFWFCRMNDNNVIQFAQKYTGGYYMNKVTSATYTDLEEWHHYYIYINTNEAVAEDRQQLWIDGVRVTAWGASQTYTSGWAGVNLGHASFVKYIGWGNAQWIDGYMADFHYLPQQLETLDRFGKFDGPDWVPKRYSGSYDRDQAFYLDFANASSLGDDESGKSNDFGEYQFGTDHQMLDSPTNNYNTASRDYQPAWTYSEGNLYVQTSSGNEGRHSTTMAIPSSGKWYAECKILTNNYREMVGIWGSSTGDKMLYTMNGNIYWPNAGYTSGFGINTIIGVLANADAGTLTFYKNNSNLGTAFSGLNFGSETWRFGGHSASDSAPEYFLWDFGQRGFAYAIPAGYKALNSVNVG
jgi:hypothetical protein